MARRTWLALVTSAIAWLAIPAVPAAAGGGGCHAAMTHGTGSAVVIKNGCFTPGIVQLKTGGRVSFSNEDPYVHNVSANGWGHLDDLDQGEGFTATFETAGVYPFACTYHPGMTGAVVVGDGTGAGNGELVTVEPLVVGETPADPAAAVASQPETTSTGPALGWVGGGAIGLVAGLGVAVLARRRVRSTS